MPVDPNNFKSVHLGGRILRYICGGDGAPPVVVDQGQGLSIELGFARPVAAGWAKVFREVRKFTRICMHDRAGLGLSSSTHMPRTSQDMVRDLRSVLRRERLPPPYILVGHSIGGLNARLFASHYPDEVAGMILVDASHPDQQERLSKTLLPEVAGEPAALRLLRHGPDSWVSPEGIDFPACAALVRRTGTLGIKPLVVLTRSPRASEPPGLPPEILSGMKSIWAELQTDLLNLSANSTQVIAGRAGHNIPIDEPQLVIDAIRTLVREIQARRFSVH